MDCPGDYRINKTPKDYRERPRDDQIDFVHTPSYPASDNPS